MYAGREAAAHSREPNSAMKTPVMSHSRPDGQKLGGPSIYPGEMPTPAGQEVDVRMLAGEVRPKRDRSRVVCPLVTARSRCQQTLSEGEGTAGIAKVARLDRSGGLGRNARLD